ncbi:MAG: primosomal protein N' [Oscillibacter sp.]|nr:primosomal protein N' [Oscillibacter sp.]
MEAAAVVKVAVSAAPYSIDKPYDYLVPEELAEGAVPGVRVTVPFGRGNRLSEGMILALSQDWKTPGLKPISSVLDREPVLDGAGLALALWMRQRYFCTMFEAVKTILPAGLWYHFRETWRLAGDLDPAAAAEAAKSVRHGPEVFAALAAMGGSAGAEDLREACEDPTAALRALQKIGLVWCETSAKQKITDKTRRMVELAVSAETALAVTEAKKKSSPARYEAVRLLAAAGRTSCADVTYFTGASAQVLRNMEKAGLVRFSEAEELRVPEPVAGEEPPPPIVLNEEQQAAYEMVLSMTEADKAAAILLHGVTGSGKTQVYLRLVQEILARGKTAIVLVPEIVLTPQIMRKFSAHLGADVAMLHSGLRMSERYDQWKRIRRGEVRVVLGTRSAIFAPLKNLGLVILDEEQEGSYQSENAPPYHAREVAKYLCARDRAVLVLGSATPSIETAWAAETGAYQKAVLRRRYNEQALPQVLIADLREEVKAGNAGSIGAVLRQELARNLERGEQSILFLNRRGNSRMLLCGECGYVPECPHCSAALTYHSANRRLMCHYCGFSHPVFEYCPDCAGVMKQIGTGTQKVEEELHELFPGTAILRMDSDTASGGHEPLLRRFEKENIPILLGTQMVTKGLDFENVTLVGVLAADLSLYIDSYRAAERTFSLLTQVVGRAGRGGKSGRAVIQTYTPENDVIRCAACQDYGSFYESEIKLRRLRRCPPFTDLFSITVSGTEEGAVLRGAAAVRNILRRMYAGAADTEVLGPAPAPVLKVKNRYRYRVLLAGRNDRAARANLSALMKDFASSPANRKLHIAVDCNTSD